MEFWGVEVKPGEVLKCNPGDDKYLHISQAALGEIKNEKENERITVYVNVDDKKVVLGSLVYGKNDQFSLNLLFEREFELLHSCTTGSVFVSGYTKLKNEASLVKHEAKKDGVKSAKPAVTTGKEGAKAKTKVKPVSGPKPGEDEESNDEEEDDQDEDEEMEGSSDGEAENDESDGDSEDESKEEDKKIPKAAGKRKPYPDSAIKSPGPNKKAKTRIPSGAQRLGADDGKKNGPKAPTSKEQKGQTPKVRSTPGSKETHTPPTSPGSEKKISEHSCPPCGKIFGTESALSQHNNAKHGKK